MAISKVTSGGIADGTLSVEDIADDAVTAAKLANSINTDIATGVTGNTTANAALPKAGGAMTGTITGFTSTGIDDNATSTAITIDSSENVGIGVVPETWDSTYKTLQLNTTAVIGGHSAGITLLAENYKYDGAHKYITTSEASRYLQNSGQHSFYVAPSGTADSAISWTDAMTIDNAGRVTMPYQPAFYVDNASIYTTALQAFGFTRAVTNVGGHYSTSTFRFTAPVSGSYEFVGIALFRSAGTTGSVETTFYKNGTNINTRGLTYSQDQTVSAHHGMTIRAILTLAAGDYITFGAHVIAAGDLYMANGLGSFSGNLLG